MKKKLISCFRCPECFKRLTLDLSSLEEDEIVSGLLGCENGHQYKIEKGIPRFIDSSSAIDNRTQKVFGSEWTTFRRYDAANLLKMSGDLPQKFFSDLVVLDAGCGSGRHALELKVSWGAKEIFGIDLSDAVITADERTRAIPDIHILQGSIYKLPFSKEFFDIVFCLGVLQHLPTPQKAFNNLVSHVKPGGKIIIWVYKKSFRKQFLEIPRFFTKRLPVKIQHYISFMVSTVFYPVVMIHRQLGLSFFSHFSEYAKYDWLTYRTDWFDRLSAPLTGYYDEFQIRDWFSDLALNDVQIFHYHDFFIGACGKKPLP